MKTEQEISPPESKSFIPPTSLTSQREPPESSNQCTKPFSYPSYPCTSDCWCNFGCLYICAVWIVCFVIYLLFYFSSLLLYERKVSLIGKPYTFCCFNISDQHEAVAVQSVPSPPQPDEISQVEKINFNVKCAGKSIPIDMFPYERISVFLKEACDQAAKKPEKMNLIYEGKLW